MLRRTCAPFAVLLAAAPLVACSCDDEGIGALLAKADVPETLDFGDVVVGLTATADLEIKNSGTSVLTFSAIKAGEGFSSGDYEFRIGTQAPLTLGPSDSGAIRVHFQAFTPGEAASSIVLTTDINDPDAPGGKKVITVRLKGRGVSAGLMIEPNPVDFGLVLSGASKTLDVTITNVLAIPVDVLTRRGADGKAELTEPQGNGRFEVLSPVSPEGSLLSGGRLLEPGQSIVAQVQYTPDPGSNGQVDQARWVVANCTDPLCDVQVYLRGRGANSALDCAPPQVDFGAVNPGLTLKRNVTCTNVATGPIALSGWALEPGTGAELAAAPSAGAPSMLGPSESVTIEVAFSPTQSTFSRGVPVTGALMVRGRNASSGRDLDPVRVALIGTAGGPAIVVTPLELNFGTVAIGTSKTKRLLIENAGYGLLEVSALDPDTSASGDITVSRAAPFTLAVGSSTVVEVTYAPSLVSTLASEMVLTTNDSANPELRIPLRGAGAELPPCRYAVSPRQVTYGVVPTFESRAQTVRIDNVGTDPCLINDVAASGDPAGPSDVFSVPSAPAGDVMLAAGASLDVSVEYRPIRSRNDSGFLDFYISDPSASSPRVPLIGTGFSTTEISCPSNVTVPAGSPVTLNASATSIGGVITGYRWTIVNAPTGGIGTPNQWSPDPPTAASERFLPYIVGQYTVRATATDSNGGTASCDVNVIAEGHGMRVTLTWNGSGDVDLHVHNGNMTPWFGNTDDCFYANLTPVWTTAQPASTGANPELDFDNTISNGPENTSIDQPVIGQTYTIGVHNFAAAAGRVATIQIFCGGVASPIQTFTSRPLVGTDNGQCTSNSFWKVASVTFSSITTCTVTPIDTYTTGTDACAQF